MIWKRGYNTIGGMRREPNDNIMRNSRLDRHDRDFTRLRIAAKVSESGGSQYNWEARENAKRELGLFSWNDPDRTKRD